MGRLVIYGAGGFGREVAHAARNEAAVAFLANKPAAAFAGIPMIAEDDVAPDDRVVIAIADGDVRRTLSTKPFRWGRVIAPTAVIGYEVEIGDGAIFSDFTIATASARIGRHFHCNIYSYVAHDCVIGDFVTFAPHVCCNGNVSIGEGSYIGTGATIRQGVRIGRNATVGMGAVVVKDVPDGQTVVGNPAAPLVCHATFAKTANEALAPRYRKTAVPSV